MIPWWLSGKESTYQCKRGRFHPWVRNIPWRRKWQTTSVFLPGESCGQRSLGRYSPWGWKNVRHDLATKQQHDSNILRKLITYLKMLAILTNRIRLFNTGWEIIPKANLLKKKLSDPTLKKKTLFKIPQMYSSIQKSCPR